MSFCGLLSIHGYKYITTFWLNCSQLRGGVRCEYSWLIKSLKPKRLQKTTCIKCAKQPEWCFKMCRKSELFPPCVFGLSSDLSLSSVLRLSPRPLRVSSTVWSTDGLVHISAGPAGGFYLEMWTLRRLCWGHRRRETTKRFAPSAEEREVTNWKWNWAGVSYHLQKRRLNVHWEGKHLGWVSAEDKDFHLWSWTTEARKREEEEGGGVYNEGKSDVENRIWKRRGCIHHKPHGWFEVIFTVYTHERVEPLLLDEWL